MIRIVFLFLFAVIGTVGISAQNRNSVLQRINAIKGNNEYYWYTFAHTNGDSAKHYATKFLLQDINYDREEGDKFSYDELREYIKYEVVDRGNSKQYLAYMNKKHAVRKLTMDETGTDKGGQTKIEPIKQPPFVPDAFVLRIKEVETFTNAYKLLRSLQANGEVLQFGNPRTVDDFSSFDLILFDTQSQKIITILSAEKAPGLRTDLLSGTDVILSGFPAELTAIIWYIRK